MEDNRSNTDASDENGERSSGKSLNFIEQIIEADLAEYKGDKHIITRFPPEPNGYLHIGHAKSICLNFGLAKKYKGQCNLRFDDTNPSKEDTEYIESIKQDIQWLGFDWGGKEYYSSDYFQQLYDWSVDMIERDLAYVDDQTPEQISLNRGTVTQPGSPSPFRNRSIAENLDLFERMKNGEFPDGAKVLRAKGDMGHSNMLMRDPIMYRIMHVYHHRTGNDWCIFPMYDWAHGESDYMEGITHSICTLEFEVHRPLYEWFLDKVYQEGRTRPKQREFARLNLSYTIMSKRKLLELVQKNIVNGWDDPRMPTISGLRRRGYTPASIRIFAEKIGVAKRDNVIDVALLEHSLKEDLNKSALRVMGVLDPIKVIITNYPEGQTEMLSTDNNPEDPDGGTREIPFSRELYIERDDFMENPPKKYFRLSPGKEVRLKSAYLIQCHDVVKDSEGNIQEVLCTYDPDTKSGSGTVTRKVKGTLHWVSVGEAIPAEIRLYDRLFLDEAPDTHKDKDFKDFVNPESLKIIRGFVEPGLKNAQTFEHFQFQRLGYFSVDPDSSPDNLVFNRTVTLRDSWSKKSDK